MTSAYTDTRSPSQRGPGRRPINERLRGPPRLTEPRSGPTVRRRTARRRTVRGSGRWPRRTPPWRLTPYNAGAWMAGRAKATAAWLLMIAPWTIAGVGLQEGSAASPDRFTKVVRGRTPAAMLVRGGAPVARRALTSRAACSDAGGVRWSGARLLPDMADGSQVDRCRFEPDTLHKTNGVLWEPRSVRRTCRNTAVHGGGLPRRCSAWSRREADWKRWVTRSSYRGRRSATPCKTTRSWCCPAAYWPR